MYQVLLVDDDKAVIYMLKRFKRWQQYGFQIADDAGDGKEALEKLSKKHFDLIVTDIRMPGMDGLEFLAELKLRQINICLVFLSTYNDFEYAQQGIRLGVFDYMIKPVEDDQLSQALDRVQQYLEERQSKGVYYPESQEKILCEHLLKASPCVVAVAEKIIQELLQVFNEDVFKTAKLLESMCFKIQEKLLIVFPWLKDIEEWTNNTLFSAVKSKSELQQDFCREIEKLSHIIKKYELHQADSMVQKTCRCVMKHVEDDITLEIVAKEVNASKDYISKLFKQKTGYNFNEYVTKVKMEHAKYLLRTGEFKNYEISEKLGYSSPDYFGRLFKNYTGFTPLEFRKRDEK